MNELFPTYKEIATALLCLIYSKGGVLQPAETYEPLADFFDLTSRARTISRGEHFGLDNHPQLAWHCLVQWGRRDLVKAGLIAQQERGIWRLTPKGKNEASLSIEKHKHLDFNKRSGRK